MQKQISILCISIFISFGSLKPMEIAEPDFPPEPAAPPAPKLSATSTTKILPDGSVQIAPLTYYTPYITYKADGSNTAKSAPVKQTTGNKYATTFPGKYIAKTKGICIAHKTVNHPSSGALGVPGSFDTFLTSLSNAPEFMPHFQKFKVLVLHDIYEYLLKVYTNMNMQHPTNTQEYITQEATYGINKKTLVINHLINIIQAQSNGLMMQIFPTFSKNSASWTGNFLSQYDPTSLEDLLIDLEKNLFMTSSDKSLINQKNQRFFTILNQYFQFFNQYTALLDTANPSTGMNSLVATAETISTAIANFTAPMNSSIKNAQGSMVSKSMAFTTGTKTFDFNAKTQALRNAKDNGSYLNPGIFFYDTDTFRGVKLIPDLAVRIGKGNFQKLGWPSQTIKEAQSNTQASYNPSPIVGISQAQTLGYPIAYFKDSNGNEVTSDQGYGLFINMPNGYSSYSVYSSNPGFSTPSTAKRTSNTSLHEQELLKQPDWLNNQDGIMKVLKACLGDFSQITGMAILSPCNEALILKAISPGTSFSSIPGWQSCQDYLNTITKTRQDYYNSTQAST